MSRDIQPILSSHPVADSFVMMIKGKILLGRACRFVRKCKAMEPEDRLLAKDTPEFRQIDGDIAMFRYVINVLSIILRPMLTMKL